MDLSKWFSSSSCPDCGSPMSGESCDECGLEGDGKASLRELRDQLTASLAVVNKLLDEETDSKKPQPAQVTTFMIQR